MGQLRDFKARDTTAGLPHDLDAEMGLLGALLYDNVNLEKIEDLIVPEVFHEPLHGRVYAVARDLVGRGRRADAVTVNHVLASEDALIDAGGIDYLKDLVELTTAARSCLEYATVIVELWRRRELIRLGDSVAKQARGGEDSTKLVETTERGILAMSIAGSGIRLIGSDEAIASVIEEYENPVRGAGVKLGLSPIDDETGGFMKGEMWCVAGRPSMGKSALAATAALNLARHGMSPSGNRLGVIEISCEMRVEQLMRRHIADLCYELYGPDAPSYSIIRRRIMTDRQRDMFYTAAHQLRDLGTLKSIYRTGLTISSLRSLIRRQMGAWARQGIETGLVIVDHMGLIRDAGAARGRTEQQGEVARDSKELAGDLGIPLLALLQLSRKVEERDDKRPMLSDLRDSGEWEQNADGVIGCYRDAYYAERQQKPRRQAEIDEWEERKASRWMEAILLKIREGQTQTVKLWTDMARNAIRGGVPESYYGGGSSGFDFSAAKAQRRESERLLDPDQALGRARTTEFG